MNSEELRAFAKDIRVDIVKCIGSIGSGHVGGSLSIADVLAVLYGKHMNIDPACPKKEGRDRLVCSKGHAGPAVYSVLAEKGFFDKEWLTTLNKGGTNLPSHCDMNKTPGIDMTAGSLGQGLSCAVGFALGSRLKKDGATIYAIIGDGETDEGQIWEAALYAGHQKLDNLIVFSDYNKCQLDGFTDDINGLDPLDKKWEAFNWDVVSLEDGNDVDAIDAAITRAKNTKGKPHMIILNTVKGKGVSFIENAAPGNHSMSMPEDKCAVAISEIRGE